MGRRGDGEKGEGVFQSSMTFSHRESRVIICGFSIDINALRAKSFMAISKCDDFTGHRIKFIRIQ